MINFKRTFVNPLASFEGSQHKATEEKQNTFKKAITCIFRCISYCAIQGIALRSHRFDTSDDSINNGNFFGLVSLLSDYVPELNSHLTSGPKNARYLSPDIQNAVIEVIANSIQSQIIEEISKSGPFSIIFDETTDRGTIEQLTLIIRY